MRNTVEESMDEFRGDLNSIYLMGTTNIKSFLVRKNKLLLITIAAQAVASISVLTIKW